MRTPSDQKLVCRFVRGRDAEAFAAIVERYRSALFSVAFGLCGNVHDAEDAVQEALTSAYVNMLRLRNPAALGLWLCGIVANKTKLQLRRSRARRALLRKLPTQEAAAAVTDEDTGRT